MSYLALAFCIAVGLPGMGVLIAAYDDRFGGDL